MINHLSVKNYQSLHNIELDLGKFTAIVGPSSSGKSALIRAIEHLTSNSSGTKYLTYGETVTTVRADTDKGSLTLKRGVKPQDNEYVITPLDANAQQTYTKLGGAVPEEVTEFIGIPAKDALNYAGQWDAPFLLKTSAGEVARVLGELTNVNIIFEAARESNRQRSSTVSTLKTRSADLEGIKSTLSRFVGLTERITALEAAEIHLDTARGLETQTVRLKTAIETLEVVDSQIAQLQARVKVDIPTLDKVESARDRLLWFKQTLGVIRAKSVIVKESTQAISTFTADMQELDTRHNELLLQAGNCPTCGQSTEGLHAH